MNNQRLNYIDGLRGIAALSVVFQHLWLPLLPITNQYIDPGLFGVYLFFYISGYIIVFSVWDNCNFAKFIIARFFRLWPIYWCSIGLYIFICKCNINFKTLMFNLTMFQRFIGIPDLLGVYWTLQVELMFYCFIIFCLLVSKVKNGNMYFYGYMISVLLSLICGIGRFLFNVKLPVAPFTGLSLILTSAIFFQYKHNNYLNIKFIKIFLVCATVIFCCVSVLSYSKDWGYHETPARFILMFICAGSLFLFVTNSYCKILNNHLLTFFGKISYPMYLFHMPLYLYLFPLLRAYYFSNYLSTMIITICTILLALGAHLFIELSSIRVGRYFIKQSSL